LLSLQTNSIKSSHLRMDSPTELYRGRRLKGGNLPKGLSHGGKGTMRKQEYSLQKQKVMQHHIYYTKYALQFADMQIPELVAVFNRQVGNTGWTNMRAYHIQALIDEFLRRSVDISDIFAIGGIL